MTEQQLQEIEQRWERWINPKSAPKTLGGDFLILLAEVRRLQIIEAAKCGDCPFMRGKRGSRTSKQSFSNERKIAKTRKAHQCFGCNKMFPAGSKLWHQSGVWDGDFYSTYMCGPCRNELNRGDYSDGFSEGELWESRYQRAKDYIEYTRAKRRINNG